MSDPEINRWKLAGQVYLWQFPHDSRDWPGWNCMADLDACQSMVAFFEIMARAQWTSTGEIPLSSPSAAMLAVPKGGQLQSPVAPQKLKIKFPKGKVRADHWAWAGSALTPDLTIGEAKVLELLDAFSGLSQGSEDFCICDRNTPRHGRDESKLAVWFWQMPGEK